MKEREKFCVWFAYSRFRCTLYSSTKQVQPYWTLCYVIRTRREREKGRKRTFYKLRIERPAIVTATFIHIGPNSWIEISKQGKIANINRMESNNKKNRNFLRNVKLALRFCSLFLFFVRSISFCCLQPISFFHSFGRLLFYCETRNIFSLLLCEKWGYMTMRYGAMCCLYST